MTLDKTRARQLLASGNLPALFVDALGWDRHTATLDVCVADTIYRLQALAQKRGMVAWKCSTPVGQCLPIYSQRRKIEHQVAKSAHEHLIVFTDEARGVQVWQWVKRELGKTTACREHTFHRSQPGDALLQKLGAITFTIEEEEQLSLTDVTLRARAGFDVDKVTKKFYDRFKDEHSAFLRLIKGIHSDTDLQWYTSLMLNRMMFVYFIQKKEFLDGNTDYLRNRLEIVQQTQGKDKFQSFYRYFLLRLFHDGLGKPPDERKLDPVMEKLIGKVPFLNGGFFEVHELERKYPDIDIPDKAFEKLFDFFDQYRWHLDERPLRADNEINPDVVGYIFEKYINQKQMGAYYTKEDITEYISKYTIIPFLFDTAAKNCAIAFRPDGAVWRLLRENPDRFIYSAVRHGVIRNDGSVVPEADLPDFVRAGMHDPKSRMHDNRYNLQQALAEDDIRLVTETWREYVNRRNRCLDIRSKLQNGEVNQINDLVTLNLDIWQFARDAIVNAEGPELLRAFWRAIAGRTDNNEIQIERGISVLDPTCGSGAFLFAALRILETLYSDCLERMERFIEDIAEKPHHPKQYSDFKKVLVQITKHPNERYFILKSIIINNLFGVDIMEEAVEICKLRLFLKLVAQIDTVELIEPLPDIDFNIRAGNTLVGYTTAEQVLKAYTEERTEDKIQSKLLLGTAAEDYLRFEESLRIVDKKFQQFRAQQTTHGGKVTTKDKQELRNSLAKLGGELDRCLAGEYGIQPENYASKTAYEKSFYNWKSTRQPFHWFVEFYGIMQAGGFDVIIGNPPYVEYSKIKKDYTIRGFKTEECGNLYAFVLERNAQLVRKRGRSGMIVPHSAICTDRMSFVQKLFTDAPAVTWLSTYCIRPAKLFVGVDQRLCIYVMLHDAFSPGLFASQYHRWHEESRPVLLTQVQYADISSMKFPNSMPKIHISQELALWHKVKQLKTLNDILAHRNGGKVFFHNAPRYWVRAMDFAPYFWNEREGEQISTQVKTLLLPSKIDATVVVAVLNSSLFYWWFLILSDCRHLNMREIENFPLGLDRIPESVKSRLAELTCNLMADFKRHKVRKECLYQATGKVVYDEFYPKHSKPIINEIDTVLAEHYGFTKDELDFIINYDIKYRIGSVDGAEGGDE